MQYLYLFIFIFFIMLNVVIGLASSRSKRRRAEEGRAAAETTISDAPDQFPEQPQYNEPHESILRPQTAENIVESFFEVEEERALLPGGNVQAQRNTPGLPEVGQAQEKVQESVQGTAGVEESKPMIDISRPSKEVKLSIEKNLLESEVESRAVERRKALDEKYEAHDPYVDRDAEKNAWENINKLPPLKRAIIFAEILGSPKSLSEGRHSE